MVDFPKESAMAGSNELETRVERVETKVDSLATSIDARFDAVDVAIAEQRGYTEFAFDRLRGEMLEGFGTMNARFDGMDARFEGIDAAAGVC
jgi:hypothetical protein